MRTRVHLIVALLLAIGSTFGCASSGERQPTPAAGEASAEIRLPDGVVIALNAVARAVAPRSEPASAWLPWWAWMGLTALVALSAASWGIWWTVRHPETARRLPLLGSLT